MKKNNLLSTIKKNINKILNYIIIILILVTGIAFVRKRKTNDFTFWSLKNCNKKTKKWEN